MNFLRAPFLCTALLPVCLACASWTGPSSPASASAAAPADERGMWQRQQDQRVRELFARNPELANHVQRLAPVITRDRTLKFTSVLLGQPGAATIVVARLQDEKTPKAWRPALAQALEQSGDPDIGQAVAYLLVDERDAEVRANLVFALRRVPSHRAQPALQRALLDSEAKVRSLAAKAAGYQARAAQETQPVDALLVAALADSNPQVVADASWACGMLKLGQAQAPLLDQLEHREAIVRLAALRALQQINPAALSAVPQRETLLRDADPRVAAQARRIWQP